MIISVEKLRELVPSTKQINDEELRVRLEALESLIRKYTNNNFQNSKIRAVGTIKNGKLNFEPKGFKIGDTIEISRSQYNNGLYVYGAECDLNVDENGFLVTKIYYPPDVVMGIVNMLKWDIEKRSKMGVASETISRHSVTYFNMDSENAAIGYPVSLVGFLKPYMKARF